MFKFWVPYPMSVPFDIRVSFFVLLFVVRFNANFNCFTLFPAIHTVFRRLRYLFVVSLVSVAPNNRFHYYVRCNIQLTQQVVWVLCAMRVFCAFFLSIISFWTHRTIVLEKRLTCNWNKKKRRQKSKLVRENKKLRTH